MKNFLSAMSCCLMAACFVTLQVATAQTVRFETNAGNIDVTLLPESAPLTVQNFLNYVNRGAYNNSFIHRSVPGFIIQGGGYQFENNNWRTIPADPAVQNEYRVSNTRGTIAMAKLGNDPNSATNQWFFNVGNNAGNLNNQNGGFTVFGRIESAAGLAVMDRIAALPTCAPNPTFTEIPLQNTASCVMTADSIVLIRSITVLDNVPAIGGVVSVSNFGAGATAAPGSYIEIYGRGLISGASRSWAATDFLAGKAPTTLDGVTVTVDDKPAYVSYVSATQINVQVPSDVRTGVDVPVVVTSNGVSTAPAALPIRATAGGLLAPASFKVAGRQYVAAVRPSTGRFVGNGAVPFVANAPAIPGETIVFYGIGFGGVTPGDVAGNIATGPSSVLTPVEFLFRDTRAQVTYAGLVSDLVGVYQFNVVVPTGLGTGDVPLRVLVGGEAIEQNLFIPVRAN